MSVWMRTSDEGESLGRIGAICLEPQPPRATAQTWGASMAGLGIRWAPFFSFQVVTIKTARY